MYSRNNLPKTIKKGAYVTNLDEHENMGTHWVALFVKPKYVVSFDSFGIEHIPKEIKHAIGNEQSSSVKHVIKKLKRIYLEYKHMIRLCVVIFVLRLLTICLMVKV